MSKQIAYITAIIAIVFCVISLPAKTANAETRLSSTLGNNSLYGEHSWTKEKSPYIIESDIYISGKLTVEPGVEIRGVKGSTNRYDKNIIITSRASFKAIGKSDDRITIKDLGTIQTSNNSEIVLQNTDISNITTHIYLYKTKANIQASTITNSATALRITDSDVRIWGSRIEKNNIGIRVIGNYIYTNPSASSTRIKINNSSIANQWDYSLRNESTEYVDVTNNWWGSENGPVFSYATISSTTGLISFSKLTLHTPWLSAKPDLEEIANEEIKCCSSILFIPGLKASRLYKDEPITFSVGTTTNRLWEPMMNIDVRSIYLDADGKSIDKTIYSGAPIDSVFTIDIYGKFMDYLDGLKAGGKIKEWKAFGYDWRKPIDKVVEEMEIKSASTESLVNTVEELAKNSTTGKVTVIAHSNGGLVMKYLVKKLQEVGKAELIDKVISVAVPYLGTPKAILGILHGYDESIAKGIIVKESTARGLGINMPSAYSLLPSAKYFENIFLPTIAFASTSIAGVNDGSYSREVNNQNEQSDFIEDTENVRIEPMSTDVTKPIKGNSLLMSVADYIHGILDPFVWPTKIASYAIVGWGQETPSGIYYAEKEKCSGILFGRTCKKVANYSAIKTLSGDGTVVTKSAEYNAGLVIGERLGEGSQAEDLKSASHADILSPKTTQNVLGEIISGNAITENVAKMSGVSIGVPALGSMDSNTSSLVISTHSPVQLHVYDDHGNHTGEIPAPQGVEDGLFVVYENKIAGSKYERTGNDDSPETYITVPTDRKYHIKIFGTDTGEFSYVVEKKRGFETIEKIEYIGLPVTPLMIASTTIATGEVLASSTQALEIDINGDSKVDISVAPNNDPDPNMFIDMLRITLDGFDVKDVRVKELLKKLSKIEKMIEKGNIKTAENKTAVVVRQVSHMKLKDLSDSDKSLVIDTIYNYLSQFE